MPSQEYSAGDLVQRPHTARPHDDAACCTAYPSKHVDNSKNMIEEHRGHDIHICITFEQNQDECVARHHQECQNDICQYMPYIGRLGELKDYLVYRLIGDPIVIVAIVESENE